MLLLLALLQQIDSTVPAERGQRLEVSSYAGDISVRSWNRNAVRVTADQEGRTRVEIDRSPGSITIRTVGHRGAPRMVDLVITVPTWMPLDISGVNTDVSVVGARGAVSVETVQGDVDVDGGEGLVSLRSVQGSVALRGAKGRLEVHSVNEDVSVGNSSGEVTAETVNGDITLRAVDASSVMSSSVNGELTYDGTIRNGGRYAFSTHNGDITITVPEGSNAAVSVSTFNGEFASEFPVTLTETRKGKRFNFTLGTGRAQMTLESFQGTIRLVRPGSSRDARDRDHDRDRDDDG
ncbi:MAG: DUF4097 family beta strand repeat protein [Gemmatimonadales bacterium]|nr:DUF4097 family beta strand repeat protein [Gemmatimonadales bacterium]